MKITIYELLGLVKDGKAPKKIKFRNEIYEYKNNIEDGFIDYAGIEKETNERFYLSSYIGNNYISDIFTDDVEIIDDEEWRTIFDFPNYEVSNKGNIRSKEYNDSLGHLRSSKKLKKQVNNCGYEYVILSSKEEKHKTLTVHRIVAKTFIPNPEEKEDVNHIDGNKLNNNVNNLEWTTTQENIIKRYEIGIDGNNYKRVSQFDKDGNLVGSFRSSYEAERITGISRTNIGGCCRGERLTAGGYVWKFEIEEPKKIEKLDVALLGQCDNWLRCPTNKVTKQDVELNPYIIDNIRENTLYFQRKINELIDEINNLKEND